MKFDIPKTKTNNNNNNNNSSNKHNNTNDKKKRVNKTETETNHEQANYMPHAKLLAKRLGGEASEPGQQRWGDTGEGDPKRVKRIENKWPGDRFGCAWLARILNLLEESTGKITKKWCCNFTLPCSIAARVLDAFRTIFFLFVFCILYFVRKRASRTEGICIGIP